jgi:hypothetical protein
LWVTIALFMAISSALAAAQRNIAFARFGLAPALLAGTLAILYTTFGRGRLDIWVHARGIAVRRGHRILTALWSEIEKVHYEESVGPAFYLVLHVGGRERLVVTSRLEALRPILESIVVRAMSIISVRCAADFHSGLDVDFGRLMLSKKRVLLRHGRGQTTTLLLEHLDCFEVREGRILIQSRGGIFCDIPVAEIANFSALESLLLRALVREPSRPRPNIGME